MKALSLSLLTTLVLPLWGCANFNSIHRESTITPSGDPHLVTVDAKQRHFILNPEFSDLSERTYPATSETSSSEPDTSGRKSDDHTPRTVKWRTPYVKWRMCAEAAPDVFSAYAASASAKGGSDGNSVSAQFGFSGSETASTIERTQAINLLRESMYRTCERYLDGAINKTILITQAARDQRSMIAFLAIEQLTRAARPPAIVISGPGTSTSIKDGETAAKMIEGFRAAAEDARLTATSADADFKAKDAKSNCSIKAGADSSDNAVTQAQLSKDFTDCVVAKNLSSTRDAEAKVAQDRLDQALKLGADTVTLINASTQTGATNAGGGGGGLDPASVTIVAKAVSDIVNFSTVDEALMFCVGYLSEPPEDKPKDGRTKTIEMCQEILKKRAETDETINAKYRDITASNIQ